MTHKFRQCRPQRWLALQCGDWFCRTIDLLRNAHETPPRPLSITLRCNAVPRDPPVPPLNSHCKTWQWKFLCTTKYIHLLYHLLVPLAENREQWKTVTRKKKSPDMEILLLRCSTICTAYRCQKIPQYKSMILNTAQMFNNVGLIYTPMIFPRGWKPICIYTVTESIPSDTLR